jgi:hypothetical protein
MSARCKDEWGRCLFFEPARLSDAVDLVTHDLDVAGTQSFAQGVFVNGWVTINAGGRLVCNGDVHCLGLTMHGNAAVVCNRLVTNVLEIDAKSAQVDVASIQARVVHHVDFALRALVDKGVVLADYLQHVGGGADYARGVNPLGEEFFEARAAGEPVILEIQAIREAQFAGKRLFRRMQPLVVQRSRTAIAAATRDPMVEQLMAWLAAHPGPQRATLEALDAEWTPRLTTLSAEARSDAVREIKRVIKSPKLVDAIDALATRLGTL